MFFIDKTKTQNIADFKLHLNKLRVYENNILYGTTKLVTTNLFPKWSFKIRQLVFELVK